MSMSLLRSTERHERSVASATTAPAGARSDRLVGLDGLRTVAVVLVLLVHADLVPGGFIGVDVFFVLSGFLITTLMIGEARRTGRLDLVGFWTRRFFRLIPALAAFVAGGVLFAAVTKPGSLGQVALNGIQTIGGTFNYTYELLGGTTAWDGHLWSLTVEAQFYLVWPFVVVLALRHLRRPGALLSAGLGVMALVALWRFVVGHGLIGGHTDWYHATDTRVDGFIAGALLAGAIEFGVAHVRTPAARRAWSWAAVLAWIPPALLVATSPRIVDDPSWAYDGGLTLVAACVVAVVGTVVLLPDHPVSRLLSSPPLVWVGRISYAFYLWHYPVIFGLEPRLDPHIGRVGTTVVAFVVAVVLAQLSMVLIERPAARLRPHIERLGLVARARRLRAANPVVDVPSVGSSSAAL